MKSVPVLAALFLIVLLLIEGWRQSPIVAALAVSVMPLAALGARPLAGAVADEGGAAVAEVPFDPEGFGPGVDALA